MSYVILFLVAAAAAICFLAWRYVSLGAGRQADDLEGSIKRIYELADPRLSLMVRQFWSDRFLQFRCVRGAQGPCLELWLPTVGWAESLHSLVLAKAQTSGLAHRRWLDNGNEFIVVVFGSQTSNAAKFSCETLTTLFGVRPHEKVRVRIDVHQSKTGVREHS